MYTQQEYDSFIQEEYDKEQAEYAQKVTLVRKQAVDTFNAADNPQYSLQILIDIMVSSIPMPSSKEELRQKYFFMLEPELPAPEANPDPEIGYDHLSIPDLRVRLMEEAASMRWIHQSMGITLADGTKILTGPDDQNRMMTTLQSMENGNIPAVSFKTANGWSTFTYTRLKEIAGMVSAYVQACYLNEQRIDTEISAGQSREALLGIDMSVGWPSNAPE